MAVEEYVDFILKYGKNGVKKFPRSALCQFIEPLIKKGQYAVIKDEEEIKALLLYYKVRSIKEALLYRGTLTKPLCYSHGNILYIHTAVIRPGFKHGMWALTKMLRAREIECDTLAYRNAKTGDWHYKVERRRNAMRDNCGIAALDGLVSGMNKRANTISMDSMSRIARDNGMLLFPMKVPKAQLEKVNFPFILQLNNHYELIEEKLHLEGATLGDDVYVLAPNVVHDFLLDSDEAKEIKGAGEGDSGLFGRKGGIGQFFSKPGRLLPMAGGAAANMLGIGPTMSNMISTGIGATQGATTNLWGERGGRAMLRGGATGLTTGLLGQGLGGGIKTAFMPSGGFGGIGAGNILPRFGAGFSENFGAAIPFGQSLGLYQPGASLNNYVNKYGGTLNANEIAALNTQAGFTPPQSAVNFGNVPSNQLALAMEGGGGGVPGYGGYGGGGAEAPIMQGAQQALQQQNAVAQEAAKQQGAKGFLGPLAGILAGQLVPEPERPPSAYDQFQEMQARGFPSTYTEEGRIAAELIKNNMLHPEQIIGYQADEYINATTQQLDAREQDELAKVSALHSQNGTYGGADWMRDVQKTQENYRLERIKTLGAINQQIFTDKVNIYLDSISTAYQLDRSNLETLMGMTGASIYEASYKYGVKAQEVAEMRKALYELASSTFPGAGANIQV